MQLIDKQIEFIKRGLRKASLVLDNQGKMQLECDLSKFPLKDGEEYGKSSKCWICFDSSNKEHIKKTIAEECKEKGSPSAFLVKLFDYGCDTPKAKPAMNEAKEELIKILKKKIAESDGVPEPTIQKSPTANLNETKYVPHSSEFSSRFIQQARQFYSEDGRSVWR